MVKQFSRLDSAQGFIIMIFTVIALMLFLVIYFFMDCDSEESEVCEHTHFAEFRSVKMKKRLDCGLEKNIHATNW